MFTEGLDERSINWIKQGTNVDQPARSPLIEKYPLDPTLNSPLFHKSDRYISPKVLPPPKFHSGLIGPRLTAFVDSDNDWESVASVSGDFCANYSDTFEEEGLVSSDSDTVEKPKNYGCNQEIEASEKLSHRTQGGLDGLCRPTLVRGPSKENLTVEVSANITCTYDELETKGNIDRNSMTPSVLSNDKQNGFHSSHGHLLNEFMPPEFQGLGTPSAPPIVGVGRENTLNLEAKQWRESNGDTQATNEKHTSDEQDVIFRSVEVSSNLESESQETYEPPERPISREGDIQLPNWQTNLPDKMSCYNTSVQSAWQTFVAYDACFRLCLNAWARNCMEAPEFLRDECMVLRNAFGLQKFLLQPRGQTQEGRHVDNIEDACSMKGKKVIGQIEVEVKRIRILPQRRKLWATTSQQKLSMQVGAEYVRQVSRMLKSHINTLKATSLPAAPEGLSCLLKLKSSSEGSLDSGSPICVKPGIGDSHVFYPESLGDALFVEVQDINKVIQGRATIQVSALDDGHGGIVRWWPIYLEDHGCVGKVQLFISISGTSDKIGSAKGGPVVETFIYDLVLEAAMRAQHFHRKNLHINGIWKWLLNEFADYYGVSDAYAKLRYLSYIMNIATPTEDCLKLLHELLLPVLKARGEKSLTRQERSILLDCEDQIMDLLATTFENYKSLDELSPTGLTDLFGPVPESAAPALLPAVKIFTLLYDILSHDAQSILKNYLQTAAAKRCRRYMVETDEFMSSNSEGFLTDHMTISSAYLKMKMLCLNISSEVQADIKIHNQHVLPSSIDLPNIAAAIYSTQLCRRLRGFLAACPPSNPSQHVTELLIATADFERQLDSWNISSVNGGVDSRDLFHNYIMVWVQDTRLHLLELCKAEKGPPPGISVHCSSSPFVEHMYDQIINNLNTYEEVIKRWPQYLLSLETVVADIERAIMKALEKQYNEILMPLRDGIPMRLEKQVQKFTRRQSTSAYLIPNQLGTFLNTVKRILDLLHCRVEDILKSWAAYLAVLDGNHVFGEQMNGIVVMFRKKYKKYMQVIVEKLITNVQANRSTRLKRILEDTKEADGEAEIRERMQALCLQLTDSIRNLYDVFSSRIFVAICRGFWDKMGQIVLTFLESRKENRRWYKGSDYALVILDDLFASEMQTLQGNSLQDKDLDPPRSVIEARSILC